MRNSPYGITVPFRANATINKFRILSMRLRLPPLAIPLLPGDPDVTVDLQAVFDRAYDAGPYRREVD